MELAQFSDLDKNREAGDKKKKKKKDSGGMQSAVASTEKIRKWNEHTKELPELETHLQTKLQKPDG